MSEHKFKVGDKVIDKNFSGQVLIVKRVYQDVIDDVVDVYREGDDSTIVKYFSKNLEPVSDHMTADEIAEMFTEASEQEKKEHFLSNPDDLSVEDKQVDEAIDALKATGYVADESILMDEDTQRLIEKVEEKVQERTKGYQIDAERLLKNTTFDDENKQVVDVDKIPEGSDVKFYWAGYRNGYEKGKVKERTRGYQEGYKVGYDMAFYVGQNKGWKIVEELFDTPINDINEIFGVIYEADVIKQYSPLEVKKKLEQYHKDQELKALQKTLLDAVTAYGKDKIIEFLDQIEEES